MGIDLINIPPSVLLLFAIDKRFKDMLDVVLSSFPLNHLTYISKDLLLYCARTNNFPMIRYLLAHGCTWHHEVFLYYIDKEDFLALDWLCTNGYTIPERGEETMVRKSKKKRKWDEPRVI